MSSIPVFQVTGNFVWGKLSGKMSKTLIVMRVMIILEFTSMIIFGFVKEYYLILTLTIIVSFVNNPFFNLQDGIAAKVSEQEHTNYAKTRMCGSLAYLIGVVSAGFLADTFGYSFVFILGASSYVICLVLLFLLKATDEEEKVGEKISFKEVLKNRKFVVYMIFFLLTLGSYNTGESYMSKYLQSLGLGVDQWGYVFGLMMIFEIVIIFVVSKCAKTTYYRILLIVGVAALTIRMGLSALPLPLWALIAIAPLRGIGWGLFLATHLNIIKKMLNSSLATKAVAILGMVQGFMIGIMNFCAPLIYQNISYNILYLILFGMALIGILVLIPIDMKFLKNNQKV